MDRRRPGRVVHCEVPISLSFGRTVAGEGGSVSQQMGASERTRFAFLVLRAQSGDRGAVAALVTALQPRVKAFVLRLVRDDALADDIAQESMVRLWRSLGALRDPRAIETWAYRVANRLVFRAAARRSAERAALAAAPLPSEADSESAPTEEEVAALKREVDALSPNTRAVVWLHYAAGLSIAETGAALEIPAGTVKSRLAGALVTLRRRLGKEHEHGR